MLPEISVLVADPSAYMAELTATMLRGLGAKAITVVTDSSGVHMALARGSYDALVIDDQLAPTDGVTLTRRLRLERTDGAELPIVMVFAHADIQRIKAARDAGVTEFIKKPMSPKILESRITQAIANPRLVVRAPAYVGPDRRRRVVAINGEDRRHAPPAAPNSPDG